MKNLIDILAKAANRMDKVGHLDLSDRIDSVLKSLAEEVEEELENEEQTVTRLQELRETLPEEAQFPTTEEYYQAVDETLQEEMEAEERGQHQHLLTGYEEDLSPAQSYMLEHDITPIEHGETSKLGEGNFGSVHRGEYKGKEVAVKITQEQVFKFDQDTPAAMNDEAQVWKEILKVKEQLSPEAQKHIPVIHDIIQEGTIQMIVMEQLEPISPDLIQVLGLYTPYMHAANRNISKHFKDLEWVNKVFEYAVDNTYDEFDKLNSREQDLLHKLVINYKPGRIDESGYLYIGKRELRKEMEAHIFNGLVNELKPGPEHQADLKEMVSTFTFPLADYIYETAFKGIPLSGKRVSDLSKEVLSNLPEARSLFSAISELAEHGIVWGDLHYQNIMSRPRTKDLVIIDVGLYDAEGKRDPSGAKTV